MPRLLPPRRPLIPPGAGRPRAPVHGPARRAGRGGGGDLGGRAGAAEDDRVLVAVGTAGLADDVARVLALADSPSHGLTFCTGSLGADPIATQQGIGFAAFSPNTTTPAWEFFQPLWDAQEDAPYDAGNPYAFSTYDLMTQTALAVAYAGSYNASAWAPAMFEVGDPPGTVCYSYPECMELIAAGEDIDYEGVTGPGTYSPGGVNAVVQSYTPFMEDGSVGESETLDPARALEVLEQIAVQAECESPNPPGTDPASPGCEW